MADQVSRMVDSPHKYSAEERELVAERVLEFPSKDGRRESLVWRKYKPEVEQVHAMGCAMQLAKRINNPAWTYEGALTTTVEDILKISSKFGSGFSIRHAPEEGIHHVEIAYRVNDGHSLTKPEMLDLKAWLRNAFGPLVAHSCN